jgi:hypothetical protein
MMTGRFPAKTITISNANWQSDREEAFIQRDFRLFGDLTVRIVLLTFGMAPKAITYNHES